MFEEVDIRTRTTYNSGFYPTISTCYDTASMKSVESLGAYPFEETKLTINFNKITIMLDEDSSNVFLDCERIINLINDSKSFVTQKHELTQSFVNFFANNRFNKIIQVLAVNRLLIQFGNEVEFHKDQWKIMKSLVEVVYQTANLFNIQIKDEITLNLAKLLYSLRFENLPFESTHLNDSIVISKAKRLDTSTEFQSLSGTKYKTVYCKVKHQIAKETLLIVFNSAIPTPGLFHFLTLELVQLSSSYKMAEVSHCIVDFATLSTNFTRGWQSLPNISSKAMNDIKSSYQSVLADKHKNLFEKIASYAYKQIRNDYNELFQTISSDNHLKTVIQNSDLERQAYDQENFRYHIEKEANLPDWLDDFYFRNNTKEEEEKDQHSEILDHPSENWSMSQNKHKFKKVIKNFFKTKLGFEKSSSKLHFFHRKHHT